MATVKSLGLHHPSGLQHAIDEQLLPVNPSPDLYKWDILTDERSQEKLEDELLTTKDAVVWCRGAIFRKTYRFDIDREPITQALFAYFPTTKDDKDGKDRMGTEKESVLEKALVVFLKTQTHIYFLSGTNHIIHMPFEVESACAAPVGVIIQRKQRAENVAPIDLTFPRVPPNSFVSSQLTALSTSQHSTFSVENLGKPKPLNLTLGSTLENMWDTHLEQPDSHWPRLVCLTDPLLDIGLVVTDSEASNIRIQKGIKKRPVFLSSAEEVLHVEQVNLPGAEPVILAITVQHEANTYTVWRLSYLEHEDPFIKRKKKSQNKSARRRSSIQPNLASGVTTPVHPNYRESFGATLPGKRPRKSERIEKPLDLVSSLEQQDKDGVQGKRRTSRRVSSMLARADLSASHERGVFSEQSHTIHGTSRRDHSIGGHNGRLSSTLNQVHPSLGSLLEAPLDWTLDEGIHNMGLDDHDFDGLQHEMMFTKLHSVPLDNSNIHISTTERPTPTRCKVFILTAPPFASNDCSRGQLLIGIQDPVEKRLQLMTLHLRLQQKFDLAAKAGKHDPSVATVAVTPGELRRAQNVVDSCKLVDGNQSVILILSESMDGRHELSTQAQWSQLTKISSKFPVLDNTRSLMSKQIAANGPSNQPMPEVMDLSDGSIIGIRHSRRGGVVDAVDKQGRLHQLKIQLEPSCPQVRKVLDICNSTLPEGLGDCVRAGWLHAMQWLHSQELTLANKEWSAVTILLLTMFLNLGRYAQSVQPTQLSIRKKRPLPGEFIPTKESEDWEALENGETPNALGCPPWMMNRGWEWMLDEDEDILPQQRKRNGNTQPTALDHTFSPKFMSSHIALARDFRASALGDAALGQFGYLPTTDSSKSSESKRRIAVDIFMGLHLLLEEQKLDIMTPEYTSPGRADLRVLLCQLARWLKWERFWSIYELGIQEDVDESHDSILKLRTPIPEPPKRPDIFQWIQSRLTRDGRETYPTPAGIFYASSNLSESESNWDNRWDTIVPRTLTFKRFFKLLKRDATAVEMVEAMQECGMTSHFLETLPEAILVPLQDAISLCQPHPPASWNDELLQLVKRSDISLILAPEKRPRPAMSNILTPTHTASWDFRLLCQSVEEANNVGYDESEGTERQAVIRALFKEDRRLNEVQDLLSTHKSRIIRLNLNPEWQDSVYLEKQKELVSRIATGTLAIPAGRALLYYSLRFPLITQKFHIGGFNLNCIVRPVNNIVGVDKSLFTEEKVCWGFFHQGVAAGLAISPQAKGIDSSWILYNKPGQELSNRHAGFLLALGLNGHLKGVAKWVAFKYLTPKHTMTSIGLLLGLAASYMGTMDSLITRLLSVHATRMLPRGAAELNLSPLTQTSGIMGIGLLYCNSQHRRMSEIMLSEIEHIDTEFQEEPLRSECYRLAAGFALGLINLGKGNDLKGLHDMKLTEKLITHATATKKVELVHILDRAAAGAVMAVTLIFIKTEDAIVARKIDVPESVLQFDYVRPDILLLRTVAKNLILWSKIKPTIEWIQSSLPAIYRFRHKLTGTKTLQSTDLPFFSIIAGLCLSIALRFSGSASPKVRDLLLHYLDQFIRITRLPPSTTEPRPYDEELARSNARMCQDVLAVSCSIVMAGTGDIPLLRRLRSLHGSEDSTTPYGSHLAAHLAIGALFLGCGTATFGSSDIAVAALLIAFYPIFPNDVMDNRSHLQAFRHFWVLATEQRCLVCKDVQTGQPVAIPVQIHMHESSDTEPVLYRTTPCLLPPLDQISRLNTNAGPQFWDVNLDFANPTLRASFAKTQSIYLRRRPPAEGAFTSTLRALGSSNLNTNPLEWLFTLDSLKNISYAERHAIMDNADDDQGTDRAVDARMELSRGVDSGDRERLEGLRVLFEWSSNRDRLLRKKASVNDSQTTVKNITDEEEGEEGQWWMREDTLATLRGHVMKGTEQ